MIIFNQDVTPEPGYFIVAAMPCSDAEYGEGMVVAQNPETGYAVSVRYDRQMFFLPRYWTSPDGKDNLAEALKDMMRRNKTTTLP